MANFNDYWLNSADISGGVEPTTLYTTRNGRIAQVDLASIGQQLGITGATTGDIRRLTYQKLKSEYGFTPNTRQLGDVAVELANQAGVPRGLANLYASQEDATNKYGIFNVSANDFLGGVTPNITPAPQFDQNALNQTIAQNAQAATNAGLVTQQQAQENQVAAGASPQNLATITAPTGQAVTMAGGVGGTEVTAPTDIKKATLWGPNGAKEVVDVGSQRASDLQSQGWVLNAKDLGTGGAVTAKKATLWGPNGAKEVVDVGSQRASQLQSQGWKLNQNEVPTTDESSTVDEGVSQTQWEQLFGTKFGATITALLDKYEDPYTYTMEMYRRVYEDNGMPTLKTQIAEANKRLTELLNERDDLIRDVNDDPWLTEAVRSKKITKLNQKYEDKTKNLTSELDRMSALYDKGTKQAEFVTGQALQMHQQGQKMTSDLIMQAIESAQKEAEFNASNYKEVQGGLYDVRSGKWVVPPKADGGLGLTPAQINATVNSIAGAFDNEPIVKEYNTVKGQYEFLKTAQKTPTDDISRVYVFARVMDPNSVVREGEYKTVQDYSQALLESKGLKIRRVFDNSGFLTDEARSFMESTIKRKADVLKIQYDNVAAQYQRQINDAYAGIPRTITDYSNAFGENGFGTTNEDPYTVPKPIPIRSNTNGTTRYLLQDGSGDTTDMTPEEYERDFGGFSDALSMAENGSVKKIATAIKKVESGGNYKARGGSGEYGAYQFMPSTWKGWAKQYLGNANAPMTPKNQDTVAQRKIADLLKKNYTVQQIALIWNGGQPVVKRGVNKYGVAYDSGVYANKVLKALS